MKTSTVVLAIAVGIIVFAAALSWRGLIIMPTMFLAVGIGAGIIGTIAREDGG